MPNPKLFKVMVEAVATLTGLSAVALLVYQPPGHVAPTEPTAVSVRVVAPDTTTTIGSPPEVAPAPVAVPESVPATLRPGDRGPATLALQQHLRALGYWLGTPDATYGALTIQAVLAFQKVEGMERTGIATEAVGRALEHAERPKAASTSGDLIEVDKTRQVLLVVRNGVASWVLNVSTGTEKTYQTGGRTERADTPPGHWRVAWTHDGVDVGALGALYRPRYFHRDGIAVHGSNNVPAYPASHGCVRVTNAAMDWIWANDLMPLGSLVWVH